MKTKDKVSKLDSGLRHKPGVSSNDFVKHYTGVLSNYAYATRDASWNELEKTLTHVLGMMIYYQRFCEIMGFKHGKDGGAFDPRDFVWDYEDRIEEDEITKVDAATDHLLHVIYNKDQPK